MMSPFFLVFDQLGDRNEATSFNGTGTTDVVPFSAVMWS